MRRASAVYTHFHSLLHFTEIRAASGAAGLPATCSRARPSRTHMGVGVGGGAANARPSRSVSTRLPFSYRK